MITVLADKKKFKAFVQTGDIHIGESRAYQGYLERHKDVLWQMLDYCEKNSLPLLISGDLFHRNDTKHEERKLAYDFLAEADRRKIYTIITTGNHDHIEGEKTQLDAILNLPFKYVKVVSWKPEVIKLGNIGVIALSWQDYTTEQIFDIVTNLYPHIADCEYKVVMIHEFIWGSAMDNGKILYRGLKLPADLPQINYWALGDIHSYQPGNLPNSWYAGAPLQFKFDDKRDKGFIKVSLPFTDKPEFIRTHFKPFVTVSSMDQMTEDAYYHLAGDVQEIVNAQNDPRVVRANWVRDVSQALDDISNQGFSIVHGLPEFLSEKGVNQEWQTKAYEFVSKVVPTAMVKEKE